MTKSDGGPAFPRIDGLEPHARSACTSVISTNGMSLRDWFAGQANVPWDAVIDTMQRNGITEDPALKDVLEVWAWMKYQAADAMLKARGGDDD